jgi:hypothetical protein
MLEILQIREVKPESEPLASAYNKLKKTSLHKAMQGKQELIKASWPIIQSLTSHGEVLE